MGEFAMFNYIRFISMNIYEAEHIISKIFQVNCLQLINPIIRYEDLRNGNFLDILMKNL